MVDVLVLNYNDCSTTENFVESIRDCCFFRKILVVDNHSTDDSFEKLYSLSDERVVVIQTEKNGGYGAGNNFGIRYLYENFASKYILLCNPDVLINEYTCRRLFVFLENNRDYAIASPFMLDANGNKLNYTAFRIPSKWEYIISLDVLLKKFTGTFCYENIVNESAGVKDVGSVAGSMFMMRVDDMLEYGMYDEKMFLYCEEMVLGIKMKKACKKIALLTDCSFIHNHSVSIRKTYKSIVSRHKIFLNSKLYVIKEYYHANVVEFFVAFLFAKVSLIECFLIGFMRRK